MLSEKRLSKESDLCSNYKNYIYLLGSTGNLIDDLECKYILFNPSIHYWICIDEIGHEIYKNVVESSSIDQVKSNLIKKYGIDNEIFENDIIPFIEDLLTNRFLSFERKDYEAEWMSKNIIMDVVGDYPFNDIYISLSDHCNLNCIYCFNKEYRKKRLDMKKNRILDKNKIIKILEEFKGIGGSGVVFTGGEPTLNKDLIDLCTEAKKLEIEPHFITNGTVLNKIDLEKLLESVKSFGISLDSIVQEEINLLWNTSSINVENDLLSALERINEIARKKEISITFMPIVSAVNMESMPKLVSKVKEKLSNCQIKWQLTQYSEIEDKKINELLAITEEEYRKCISSSLNKAYIEEESKVTKMTIEEKEKLENKINAYSFSESGKLLPPTAPKLLTCAPSFLVTNNGDVYPCQGFEKEKYLLGNVWEESLSHLYNKDEFKEVRKKITVNLIQRCSECELRFVCTNKCGGCKEECGLSIDECKELTIQKLYLQTKSM